MPASNPATASVPNKTPTKKGVPMTNIPGTTIDLMEAVVLISMQA